MIRFPFIAQRKVGIACIVIGAIILSVGIAGVSVPEPTMFLNPANASRCLLAFPFPTILGVILVATSKGLQ